MPPTKETKTAVQPIMGTRVAKTPNPIGRPVEADLDDDLGQLAVGLTYWIGIRGFSRRALAIKARLDPSTLIKIMKGQRSSIRPATVDALASALEVSMAALYSMIDDELLSLLSDPDDRDATREFLKSRRALKHSRAVSKLSGRSRSAR